MAIKSLRLKLDKLPPADPASNTTSPQLPPLLRLPVELHLEIVSYLSSEQCCRVLDRFTLRLVNRYFYYGLDAPTIDQLRVLESSDCGMYHQVYAFKYCLCLRRADKFADNMLKGDYQKIFCDPVPCLKARWCADCGFDKRSPVCYPRGVHVMVNGVPWLHCIGCYKVKKGTEVGKTPCKELCKDCHARYGCLYVKGHPKRRCKFNPHFYSARK